MDEKLVFDVMTDENGFVALPFCLAGQDGAVVVVDWHDEEGKEERMTAENALGGNGCIHRYTDSRIWHRIELTSPDWSKVYICGIAFVTENSHSFLPMMSFAAIALRCRWRLKSVLPALAGTAVMKVDDIGTPFEWKPEFYADTMDCAFTLMRELEEIPVDAFTCKKWTSFEGTFCGCTFLEPVPVGLFKEQDANASLAACFARCKFADGELPSRLFVGCSNVKLMKGVFAGSNVTSLPDDLFFDCASVTDYSFAFAGTGISLLPKSKMFHYSSNAEIFDGCFSGCKKLQVAPTGLFIGTSAKTAYRCFADCISLDMLGGVFNGCTEMETLESCFIGCSKLNGVPADLFWGCRKAVNFTDCFAGCTRLIYVNAGLCADFANAKSMAGMFRSCRSIKSIPEGMFSGCVNVKTFAGVFEDCISLESVEENVFRDCGSVESFRGAFAKCSNLRRVPVNIFAWSPKARDFGCCFDGCASLKDADIRIDSGCVEDAESFFTYNPSSRARGRNLTVYVPDDTQTAKLFSMWAFDNDWNVMKFHG